jgi:NAD-dependent dihydropyrimidine dehydrogenase PreA subunit
MTYVITGACKGVKDTSCVAVCPVDCIHPMPEASDFDAQDMLYIDPEVCIDCGLCVDECPVHAIYVEDDLPEDQLVYVEINRDYFRRIRGEVEP